MSAGEPIMMPFAWWQGAVALIGAGGLGGALTALIQRPARRAVDAAAARDEATGEAAVIAAMAGAFTGTMGGMREEVERLQERLDALHTRVIEAEAALKAAAVREAAGEARERVLEQVIEDQKRQLETSHADVVRIRAERDVALERVTQQEGEIRQQHAVIDAMKRTGERA